MNKSQAASAIMVVILALASVWVTSVVTAPPPNPDIRVALNSAGGIIQNITISCFQCPPSTQDKWNGKLLINGKAAIDIHYPGNGSSTSLQLGMARQSLRPLGSTCPEYSTNSTCYYALPNASLPFNLTISLHKAITAGHLRAKIFLADGAWYSFDESTNLERTFAYR